jgi:hypothetical protein
MPSREQLQKAKLDQLAATVKFATQDQDLRRGTIMYNSTSGLNDTPKGVIDGIKDQLCELDDTLAETSPFVWLPAKYYRLKKSSPELFDIDVDIYQPIASLTKKEVEQGMMTNEDEAEISGLLRDISEIPPPKKKTPTPNSLTRSEKSARYIGSVASDPAVLALLHSSPSPKRKAKRRTIGASPKYSPPAGSRVPTARTNRTSRTNCTARSGRGANNSNVGIGSSRRQLPVDSLSKLPGISPLSVSRSNRLTNRDGLSVTGFTPRPSARILEQPLPIEEKAPDTYKHPVKKLKGIATVMDLSELSRGLPRKGTLYRDCYNEYGIQEELKKVYAMNTAHWIPRTEQTVINEKMALDRKLQKMIAGLEY